jgi:hypothetical protein
MKPTKYLIKLFSLILLLIVFGSGRAKSSFMLVLLPDTQTYTSNYPEIFKSQTSWIAENAKNIAFVLHQGDITDNNSEEQWKVAAESFSKLDGKVPYTFVPGNHDTGEGGKTLDRNMTMLNKFMPYSKYSQVPGFGGAFVPGEMANTWHTFKAGGYDWLILSLEFGPRNKVLDWAAGIIENHPRHKIIINTHAYLYSDNTRMGEGKGQKWLPQNYPVGKDVGPEAANNGEQMWEKLIKNYPNIMFVFCGHVLNRGTGMLVSEGIHGNKVYQMLANYQGGVEGTENGGNGFLRLIKIDPKNSSVSVKTYSPYLNKYKTEPDQEFTFENVKF